LAEENPTEIGLGIVDPQLYVSHQPCCRSKRIVGQCVYEICCAERSIEINPGSASSRAPGGQGVKSIVPRRRVGCCRITAIVYRSNSLAPILQESMQCKNRTWMLRILCHCRDRKLDRTNPSARWNPAKIKLEQRPASSLRGSSCWDGNKRPKIIIRIAFEERCIGGRNQVRHQFRSARVSRDDYNAKLQGQTASNQPTELPIMWAQGFCTHKSAAKITELLELVAQPIKSADQGRSAWRSGQVLPGAVVRPKVPGRDLVSSEYKRSPRQPRRTSRR